MTGKLLDLDAYRKRRMDGFAFLDECIAAIREHNKSLGGRLFSVLRLAHDEELAFTDDEMEYISRGVFQEHVNPGHR